VKPDATRIAVIDYGMGNLHSVARALQHVAPSARVRVTCEAREVRGADRVVFPGQGAMGVCRRELERLDLVEVLRRAAAERPFFGMCLGPQALMSFSEENGGTPGLGVFPGRVVRFPVDLAEAGQRLKIPHMGWNQVSCTMDHPLWTGIADAAWFYFVHSYYLCPEQPEVVAGVTDYGMRFPSAIARDNVFAVQFHPEKSARDGLRLLANFCAWNPS
jgi:glutamine amidotransferase